MTAFEVYFLRVCFRRPATDGARAEEDLSLSVEDNGAGEFIL